MEISVGVREIPNWKYQYINGIYISTMEIRVGIREIPKWNSKYINGGITWKL